MLSIVKYEVFNCGYCISSVLIGSLSSGIRLYSKSPYMKVHRTSCCGAERRSKYPNSEDFIKFNKTIIPFTLVWYEIGYSKVSATHLVGYLPFHIQCALIKKLLNIALKWIKSLVFFFFKRNNSYGEVTLVSPVD